MWPLTTYRASRQHVNPLAAVTFGKLVTYILVHNAQSAGMFTSGPRLCERGGGVGRRREGERGWEVGRRERGREEGRERGEWEGGGDILRERER